MKGTTPIKGRDKRGRRCAFAPRLSPVSGLRVGAPPLRPASGLAAAPPGPALDGGSLPVASLKRGTTTMLSANITKATRRAIYRRDGYRCALCDSTDGIQIHHAVARGKGGTDYAHNLVTLCWRCHAVAHGTRMPECPDWMGAVELHEACIEYLADLYAPDWYPW